MTALGKSQLQFVKPKWTYVFMPMVSHKMWRRNSKVKSCSCLCVLLDEWVGNLKKETQWKKSLRGWRENVKEKRKLMVKREVGSEGH